MSRQEEFLTGEGEEVGDGGAEGSLATGDGGQGAISLTPDVDSMHLPIFDSSELGGSYVGDYTQLSEKPLGNVIIDFADSREN